jgi:hypothetical protein
MKGKRNEVNFSLFVVCKVQPRKGGREREREGERGRERPKSLVWSMSYYNGELESEWDAKRERERNGRKLTKGETEKHTKRLICRGAEREM